MANNDPDAIKAAIAAAQAEADRRNGIPGARLSFQHFLAEVRVDVENGVVTRVNGEPV